MGDVGWCRLVGVDVDMDVSENSGFYLQIIHFNLGFPLQTIHFGVPLFLEIPIWGSVAFELFELVFTVV